ncbi:MAG: DUF1573 domain-containing protein [Spirochaetales bacterium]|nr:DUF1573 domain-containing protein [Spirochaetales bacterium]
MKNIFFNCILLILCIIILTGSCNKAKIPGIKFSTLTYDFGEVEQGVNPEYAFEFTNTGNGTLKILEIKPNCGCTIPGNYTKEVAPGDTGYIPVVFNTKGLHGNEEKKIKVTTNIPESEPVYLIIKGVINIYIIINPNYIFLGNTVVDGPPIKGRTSLKNFSDTPLTIVSAKLTGERSSINVNPVKEGFEYIIEMTETGPFKPGQVKEMLTLTIQLKDERVYELPYIYNGTPDIEVIPGEITIFPEQERGELKKIFSVISHTDTLIEIINPELHGKSMNFIIEEFKPKKGYQITINFEKNFVFPGNDIYYFSFDLKTGKDMTRYTVPFKRQEDTQKNR